MDALPPATFDFPAWVAEIQDDQPILTIVLDQCTAPLLCLIPTAVEFSAKTPDRVGI